MAKKIKKIKCFACGHMRNPERCEWCGEWAKSFEEWKESRRKFEEERKKIVKKREELARLFDEMNKGYGD